MTFDLRWLEAHGADRQLAVENAAETLMRDYRSKYGSMIPPELHRLAALLEGKIVYVDGLPGGARLVPVHGGFEILVDSTLSVSRMRTAIAHELAHTLFYSRAESIPRRLSAPSKWEEHFCFDVARRVLAPEWMIRVTGIADLNDISEMFHATSRTFKLGRQTASRVLLQDHRLLSGVAAIWVKLGEQWRMKPGNCYASSNLSKKERQYLHEIARAWLKDGSAQSDVPAIGFVDSARQTAFVLVASRIRAMGACG